MTISSCDPKRLYQFSTIQFIAVLFCIALVFFAIFTPMGQVPSDTEYSIDTAHAIVVNGTIAVPANPRLSYLVLGKDGKYYSNFGIGYALLFVPQVAVAHWLSSVFKCNGDYLEQAMCSFTNTVFAAVIIVLFFAIFSLLGYSKRISLVSATCIAIGSILLPYSKINHAETPTVVIVLLFLLSVAQKRNLTVKYGIYLAALTVMMLLVRVGNLVYCCGMALYVLWLLFNQRRLYPGFVWYFCLVSIAGFAYLGFNFMRFGDLFNTGYGAEQMLFTTPLLTGLTGLLFSPSKSIFIFSPLIILSIIAVPSMYKKSRPLTVVICGLAVANILFYAKWRDWHGGWCWGPRLIVPAILIVHCFLPQCIKIFGKKIWFRIVFYLLLISALYGNMVGALVWYQQICHFHRDYWSVRYSELVTGSKLLVSKLQNKPETYCIKDFGLEKSADYYGRVFSVRVRGDSLDFSDFEKFRGLSTMWSGLAKNFHVPFLWIIPICLFLLSFTGYFLLWKSSDPSSSSS